MKQPLRSSFGEVLHRNIVDLSGRFGLIWKNVCPLENDICAEKLFPALIYQRFVRQIRHCVSSKQTVSEYLCNFTLLTSRDLVKMIICSEQESVLKASISFCNKMNLNSLLVKRQVDNPSPGAVTGGNKSLALAREVNLDTLSSDSSEEEIRDSGRSFQSLLIVWGQTSLLAEGI